MTQEAAELLTKTLSLPASERADLAGSLIESLDDTQDEWLKRPGTKAPAAWPTRTPAATSRFRSKRLVAASCPLWNERSRILLIRPPSKKPTRPDKSEA